MANPHDLIQSVGEEVETCTERLHAALMANHAQEAANVADALHSAACAYHELVQAAEYTEDS